MSESLVSVYALECLVGSLRFRFFSVTLCPEEDWSSLQAGATSREGESSFLVPVCPCWSLGRLGWWTRALGKEEDVCVLAILCMFGSSPGVFVSL